MYTRTRLGGAWNVSNVLCGGRLNVSYRREGIFGSDGTDVYLQSVEMYMLIESIMYIMSMFI